jgi:hypothetical protein
MLNLIPVYKNLLKILEFLRLRKPLYKASIC